MVAVTPQPKGRRARSKSEQPDPSAGRQKARNEGHATLPFVPQGRLAQGDIQEITNNSLT
jgi:hypothetical protein